MIVNFTSKRTSYLLASIQNDNNFSFFNPFKEDNDCKLICAVDLGATWCCCGYILKDNQDEIHLFDDFNCFTKDIDKYKIRTVALYNHDNELLNFGDGAVIDYIQMKQKSSKDCNIVKGLELCQGGLKYSHKIQEEVTSVEGHKIPTKVAVKNILAYFKTQMLTRLESLLDYPIKEEEVAWIITGCDLCCSNGKILIQECALEAGMGQKISPYRLHIISATESISNYIFTSKEFKDTLTSEVVEDSNSNETALKQTSLIPAYMILDIGSHHSGISIVPCNVEAVIKGECEFFSDTISTGHHVDLEFSKWLDSFFGENIVEKFKKEKLTVWNEFIVKLEKIKRSLKVFGESITIPISDEMETNFKKFNKKISLKQHISKMKQSLVTYENSSLVFPIKFLKKFFKVYDEIAEITTEVAKRYHRYEIQKMILVGGHSESIILLDQIAYELRQKSIDLKMVSSPEARLISIKGALTYFKNPKASLIRRSAKSYGVGIIEQVEGSIDCELFDPLILAHENFEIGQKLIRNYYLLIKDSYKFIIKVYSSDDKFVKTCHDDNCVLCVRIVLDVDKRMSKLPDDIKRQCSVIATVEEGSLQIEVIDVAFKNKVETTIIFDCY